MTTHADISGAFVRPTLVEYLLVAEHQRLDLALHLHIGALAVGIVGVSGGRVVHAELPGASGDSALTLLARLPDARIMPQGWTPRVTNVESSWRELIPEVTQESSPGRSQRLAEVRAELRELAEEIAAEEPAAEQPVSEADARTKRIAAELLDWAAIEAYMSGDIERARFLVQRSEEVHPGQLICAANLERLRLRLLEDEIAADVVGAAQ